MHHAHSWHSAKYIHPWLEIYSPLTWNIFALTKHSAANVPCIIHHPMTWGLSRYQVFPSLDKNLTAVNGKKVARSFRTNKSRLSARKTVFWGGGDLPGGGGAREPARKEGRKGGRRATHWRSLLLCCCRRCSCHNPPPPWLAANILRAFGERGSNIFPSKIMKFSYINNINCDFNHILTM